MFKLFSIAFILYSCSVQVPQQKNDMSKNVDILRSKQNEIIKPVNTYNYQQNDPNKK